MAGSIRRMSDFFRGARWQEADQASQIPREIIPQIINHLGDSKRKRCFQYEQYRFQAKLVDQRVLICPTSKTAKRAIELQLIHYTKVEFGEQGGGRKPKESRALRSDSIDSSEQGGSRDREKDGVQYSEIVRPNSEQVARKMVRFLSIDGFRNTLGEKTLSNPKENSDFIRRKRRQSLLEASTDTRLPSPSNSLESVHSEPVKREHWKPVLLPAKVYGSPMLIRKHRDRSRAILNHKMRLELQIEFLQNHKPNDPSLPALLEEWRYAMTLVQQWRMRNILDIQTRFKAAG
ncbi:MAG: hypothetical protein S4CHLAM81_01210 [Chlamydiales bacterium]|nr:hypothetical protein [Chlamydiales bacterium]MCH9634917.1 hypothetical protein [Chlamydiales bacterium]MCH9704438.1 hypothetical protein [Chlamydiota bacterium]